MVSGKGGVILPIKDENTWSRKIKGGEWPVLGLGDEILHQL